MRHALLTGFPGFLATQLLDRLAGEAERFTLLVEERFAARAREEAARIAGAAGAAPDRFEVVLGDITRPELGLAAGEAGRLRSAVDTLFHLAAIYDLAVPADLAQRVNVGGTETVNAFVRGLSRLDRYHYFSTFAVSGRRTGVIREAELEHDAGFHNHYEETKYRAEVAVQRLSADGLPVTIYRPAAVVGSSQDGRTAKFDGPYMVLKMMRRMPRLMTRFNVGTSAVRFQMVPVDFIVAAVAALAARPDTAGKTFHLTDPDPLTTAEIVDLFSQALFRRKTWMRAPSFLVRAATRSGLTESWGLLPQAAAYFYHQARWDCVNTLDALDGTGVEVPRLAAYVDKLVAFFLAHERDGAPSP
jgi:thioester reductase-like protein